MLKIENIKFSKIPLGERIANLLRREIMLGTIKAGERLIEQALSTRFNTSRGPIRDAIMKLEMEGLVERSQTGRAVAQQFLIKDVENLYKVRELIEMEAVSTLDYTNINIKDLEKQIELMKNAFLRKEKDIYADLDFHRYIVKLSNNKALIMVWDSLSDMFHSLIDITTDYNVFDQEKTIHYHEMILHEIATNNIKDAKKYLSEHLTMANKYYCHVMEIIHEKGDRCND